MGTWKTGNMYSWELFTKVSGTIQCALFHYQSFKPALKKKEKKDSLHYFLQNKNWL